MRVEKTIRQAMLNDVLWEEIKKGFVLSIGKIEFFDSDDVSLCELSFDDMEIVSTGTDDAIMRLKSIDESFTLKGTAHTIGVVSKFKILGDSSEYILTGSVGTLTSSSELKFNKTSWSNGTFISIENFDIKILNGA